MPLRLRHGELYAALSPMLASAAMSLSSVSVITNASACAGSGSTELGVRCYGVAGTTWSSAIIPFSACSGIWQ